MGNRTVCPNGTQRCAFPIACPRDAHCRVYGFPLRDRDGIPFQEPPLGIPVKRPATNRAVHDAGIEIHQDIDGTSAGDVPSSGLFSAFLARSSGTIPTGNWASQDILRDGGITIRCATSSTLCILWGEI